MENIMRLPGKTLPERIREYVDKQEPRKYADIVYDELIDAFSGNRNRPLTQYHKQVWAIVSK